MTRRLPVLFTVAAAIALLVPARVETRQSPGEDGVTRLVRRLEQVAQGGRIDSYLDLLVGGADIGAAREAVASLILPDATRTVIRERDRAPLEGTLPGNGYRLMLEVLIERGTRARVATWNLDVRRIPTAQSEDEWLIEGQRQLSTLDGLFRLSLSTRQQYRARNLVVRSDDLLIRLPDGLVFVAESPDGPTAVVMLPENAGAFVFRPTPETEREQVRLYSGSDSIEGRYEEVFLRLNPADFNRRFSPAELVAEPVDPAAFRRAEAVFREEVGKTFSLDLGDLTRDTWLVAPRDGELLAEIRTRRFETLTYTKSMTEIEDVGVFDRKRRRNISLYSSPERLARSGRSYDEDALADYDVLDYDVDTTIEPVRQSLEGVTRLKVRIRSSALSTLTLRLADTLKVKSVYSVEFGRLFAFRVRNQHAVVINLPGTVVGGTEMTLIVSYGGPLAPSRPDGEAQFPQQAEPNDLASFAGEPSLLYSTKSYWHAQGAAADYATGRLRVSVPSGYGVLASGSLDPGSPEILPGPPGQPPYLRFAFVVQQPVRYMACLVSRFTKVSSGSLDLRGELGRAKGGPGGQADLAWTPRKGTAVIDSLFLSVDANPRQVGKGRQVTTASEAIARFYTSVVGDCPYPSLSIALIESETPGGHSPAYLSVINQPLAGSGLSWANDPASFPSYPEFFAAHEIAHQWWGQAVGWRNYHEQWISEGFAQYFAALYAQQSRGEGTFADLMRRMARWGHDSSAQGPISLGYRLGHIRGDSRVFRALIYNKSAAVLNMLRRVVGDRAFFRGLQRFYFDARFRKVGTTEVRAAFEREVGRSLDLFFEGWVYSSAVPNLRFSWRQEGEGDGRVAVLTFDQIGRVFELPLTVTLKYADGRSVDTMAALREKSTEIRLPLSGRLRGIDLNREGSTIVDIERK
jgi:hypothetical protein